MTATSPTGTAGGRVCRTLAVTSSDDKSFTQITPTVDRYVKCFALESLTYQLQWCSTITVHEYNFVRKYLYIQENISYIFCYIHWTAVVICSTLILHIKHITLLNIIRCFRFLCWLDTLKLEYFWYFKYNLLIILQIQGFTYYTVVLLLFSNKWSEYFCHDC